MIILGLAVLGLGLYFFTRREGTSTAPEALTNQTQTQAVNEASEFARAIENGQPTLCTLAKGSETMEYRLKGKLLRAKINTGSVVSHMISDTQNFYMWADGQNQGTKIAVPTEDEVKDVGEQTQQSAPSLDDEADYNALQSQGYTINCQPGNISDADFIPPAEVTFTDLSAIMQQVSPSGNPNGIDIQKLQQQYGGAN